MKYSKPPSHARYRQTLTRKQQRIWDKLPERNKDKLCLMSHDDAVWRSEMAVHHDQYQGKLSELRDAQTRLARFDFARSRGEARNKQDDADEKEAASEEKAIKADLAEITPPPPPVIMTEAAWEFLESHPDTAWNHETGLWEGGCTLEDRAKLWVKLDKAKAAKKQASGANLTLAEGDAALEAAVRGIAQGGDIRPQRVLRQLPGPRGSKQGRPTWTLNPDGKITPERVLAIICDVFGDEMIAKYAARLRENYNPKTALSVIERTRAIAKLDDAVMQLEHADEAMYLEMRKAGLPAVRRQNARIEAVLEITPNRDAKPAASVPEAGKTRGSLAIAHAGDPEEFDFDSPA